MLFTASLIFDVPLKEVTPDMRFKAKAVNFGILYGQQAFGLAQATGIEYKEAAAFIDTYFHRYKKVKEFIELLQGKRSKDRQGRDNNRPAAPHTRNETAEMWMFAPQPNGLPIDAPLQGANADIIKMAMIKIDRRPALKEEKMLLQIHDELLFEVADISDP